MIFSRSHVLTDVGGCTSAPSSFSRLDSISDLPPPPLLSRDNRQTDGRTDPESAPTRNGAFWMVERTDGRSDGGAAPDRETVPVEGRRAATRTSGRAPPLTHFLRTRCPLSLPPKSPEQLQQCNSKRWESCVTFLGKFGRQRQQC